MARLRQQQLPGTETPTLVIEALEAAGDHYTEIRDERMGLTKREKQARLAVETLMEEHGLPEYTYDGKIIKMSVKKKATIRTMPEANGEEDEDDEEDGDEE